MVFERGVRGNAITLDGFVGLTGALGEDIRTREFNSTIVGFNAASNNSGIRNTIYGYEAALALTTISDVTIIGYRAGESMSIFGTQNVLIGNQAGSQLNGGIRNTILGYRAGFDSLINGSENVINGWRAGESSEGNFNVFVGSQIGLNNDAERNTFLGYRAGANNTIGDEGTFIGSESGEDNLSGDDNIFIGIRSGKGNTSGNRNTVVSGAPADDINRILNPNQAVVVGWTNFASGDDSAQVGNFLSNTADDSMLLGNTITNSGIRSICIGNNINNSGADSIIIRTNNNGASGTLTNGADDQLIIEGFISGTYGGTLNFLTDLDLTANVTAVQDAEFQGDVTMCNDLDVYGIITMRSLSNTGYWEIKTQDNSGNPSLDLVLESNNGARIEYVDQFSATLFNFTGQHRCSTEENISEFNIDDFIGKIAISDGIYNDLNNDNKITIDEAIPYISLCKKKHDKRVFGVISGIEEDNDRREFKIGNLKFNFGKNKKENKVIVNSTGEGGIWVCNISGNFANGDLITTSDIAGYGMKQRSSNIKNHTVGKITCDCNFDLDSGIYQCIEIIYEKRKIRVAFVGCVYYC